jgi:hypothetical protein
VLGPSLRFVADVLVIMKRPAPDLQTVDYATSRGRPWRRRRLKAGLMLAAFTSGDGKFRTRMDKAGPEHQEYKSGYESNEFISWPACQVD